MTSKWLSISRPPRIHIADVHLAAVARLPATGSFKDVDVLALHLAPSRTR